MSLFKLPKNQEELEAHVKNNIAFSEEMGELYNRIPLFFKSADFDNNSITFLHKVGEFSKNRYGNMHGGAIAQLLDTAMGLVAYELGVGNASPTMDININYISAAHIGDELEIRAEAINRGKHNAVLRAEMKRDDVMIAFATATYRLYTSTIPEKKIFD